MCPASLCAGIVELPYIFITTGLFVNVFYWFVGMAMPPPISKFILYWVFFGLYITCTVRALEDSGRAYHLI